jgi:hypothetical protein
VSTTPSFSPPVSSAVSTSFAPAPVTGFGGKLAPPDAPQPLL